MLQMRPTQQMRAAHAPRSFKPRILRPRAQCSPPARAYAAAGDTLTASANVLPGDDSTWESFSGNVCGEWEGITATFSPTGEPQLLPENYVPEAFREWGVELRDWQSQCSTLTTEDGGAKQLKSVLRRLMPTVGCEADAIAFTEEPYSSRDSGSDTGIGNTLLLAAADGSYSTGPVAASKAAQGITQLQIEHCFMLPLVAGSSSDRFRIKVVQKLRRNWAVEGAWKLAEVDLHKERYDGPFTGKRELAGCGGGQPAIAAQPALEQQQLAGSWSAVSGVCYTLNAATGQLESSNSSSSLSCLNDARDSSSSSSTHVALLPLGAWSAVELSASGQLHRAEAGVMLHQQQQGQGSTEPRQRLVSVRRHEDGGRLLMAALVLECDAP